MVFFEEAALRLKQQLHVTEDQEAAALLGLSKHAWMGRKKRENFPEKELRALAQRRPELGLDVDYVLGTMTPIQRKGLADLRNDINSLHDQAGTPEWLRLKNMARLERWEEGLKANNARRWNAYQRIDNAMRRLPDESLEMLGQLASYLLLLHSQHNELLPQWHPPSAEE